ncbi:hypothetical protein F-VV10_0145 [Faustovirus]|nr:hypothetical protein F-VV10_0145 [Faustovirus]
MQQPGLINRTNYDPKILSVFEIIGCYFVDTFYNSLFLKAREKTQLEGARSITDAYKSNIINYLRGVKDNAELYRHVVKQLCDYFRSATRYSTITFGEFEDKTVRCFIPQEYFNDLTERDKDSLLNVIILRIIEDFSIKVIKQEFLKMIIDDHSNRGNIDVLKNIITDIMILIRESYFEMFMKKIVDNGNKDRDKVDVELVRKANKALAEEIKMRVKLENEVISAKNVISGLLMKLKTLESERDAAVSAKDAALRDLELKRGEIRALQVALKDKQPRGRGRPKKSTPDDDSSDDDSTNQWYARDVVDSTTGRQEAPQKFTPEGFNAPKTTPGDNLNQKIKEIKITPINNDSSDESDDESSVESEDEKPEQALNFNFATDDIGFGFD